MLLELEEQEMNNCCSRGVTLSCLRLPDYIYYNKYPRNAKKKKKIYGGHEWPYQRHSHSHDILIFINISSWSCRICFSKFRTRSWRLDLTVMLLDLAFLPSCLQAAAACNRNREQDASCLIFDCSELEFRID
ncbi:unnamed protein product [Amoebophrya sp. A25]|nr:unnamed protein product [Amoebophrya sp. A25]|eukprot:GSA25T00002986001.1